MGFVNDRLPTNYNYGSSGGPGYRTNVLKLRSGARRAIERQSAARRIYDAGYTIKAVEDAYKVLTFFTSIGGAGSTFRWKDWIDYATTADGTTHHAYSTINADELIGTGDGSTTQFQLVKSYSNAVATRYRTIRLPVAGTVKVAVDGSAQTEGSDFSVNTETGIITFASAPANTLAITAGFEFDVPVAFTQDADVQLAATIDSFDSNSVPNITLEEDLDMVADPELTTNGGSKDFGTTTMVQSISLANGRALRFSPTAAHNIIFPSATSIETGGPIFGIFNQGSETLTLKYSDTTTTIGSVTAGTMAELWLLEILSSGLKEWQLK